MNGKVLNKARLKRELKQIAYDYKASVVAGEITGNGVHIDSIVFKNLSIFRRFVSKEIERISWDETSDQPDKIIFQLNKEGLYDMLPEAVTHDYNVKKADLSASERFSEHKIQEKNARTFFFPIENEFAQRILYFDIFERELLKNSNPIKNTEFFEYFFGKTLNLSNSQVVILMYLLPLSHKIRSDVKLISLALSKILDYNVTVSKKHIPTTIHVANTPDTYLGNGKLGINTILSDKSHSYKYCYYITISDVQTTEYRYFFNHEKYKNVLDFVCPYFFPANGEIEVQLQPVKEESIIRTSSEDNQCFLGFNSYI